MNAMCLPETRVYNGKVFIQPAEPGVVCLLRRVQIVSGEKEPPAGHWVGWMKTLPLETLVSGQQTAFFGDWQLQK